MKGNWKTPVLAAIAAGALAGGAAWWLRGASLSVRAEGNDAGKEQAVKTMYNCPMHPWIIKDKPGTCPICGMDLVPMKDHGHAPPAEAGKDVVRIDPSVIQNMGVRTEEVRARELSKVIRLTGRLAEDETRQVSVNAKIMGWVEKLHADYLGKPVKAGETLMELYSPDLLATQEDYLQALRYARNLPDQASPEARRGAEDLVRSARRRLENWDIPASAIERLGREGKPSKTLPIVSPASGVVLSKNVVEGQNIMAGTELLRIADLSRIWALGEIYQEDLPYVKVGQHADVLISYLPGKSFPGKVSFISPVLDPQSKTALVRVELRNTPDLQLKPQMVADVELAFPLGEGLAVPDQAIIRTGRRNVAIVSLGGGYFEPREVRLGASAGEYVQILGGLREGDQLVTSSQFLIDSESNLKTAVMGMSQHNHGGGFGSKTQQGRPDGAGPSGDARPAPDAGAGSAEAAEEPRPGGPAPEAAAPAETSGMAAPRAPAGHDARAGLERMFGAYLDLQSALAADDLETALRAAAAFRKAVGEARSHSGPGSDGSDYHKRRPDGEGALAAASAAMAEARDLEGIRASLPEATDALVSLARASGAALPGGPRLFHCPMARDGRGADWIQSGTGTRNPYYGPAMLTCGTDKGIL